MTDLISPYNDSMPLVAAPGSVRIALSAVPGPAGGPISVYNSGSAVARVKIGDVSVLATAASMPVPPGEFQTFDAGSASHIAAWCASGTVALEVFNGGGV